MTGRGHAPRTVCWRQTNPGTLFCNTYLLARPDHVAVGRGRRGRLQEKVSMTEVHMQYTIYCVEGAGDSMAAYYTLRVTSGPERRKVRG